MLRIGVPTRSTIQYVQHGNKPNSRVVLSCGGFLSIKLSLEWEKSNNEICMYIFICPQVMMRGIRRLAYSDCRKSHKRNRLRLGEGKILTIEKETLSGGNLTIEHFDSNKMSRKARRKVWVLTLCYGY